MSHCAIHSYHPFRGYAQTAIRYLTQDECRYYCTELNWPEKKHPSQALAIVCVCSLEAHRIILPLVRASKLLLMGQRQRSSSTRCAMVFQVRALWYTLHKFSLNTS